MCVCVGSAKSVGSASTEAVRHTSCLAAVSQLPQPGPVTLPDVETDEATHAGASDRKHLNCLSL